MGKEKKYANVILPLALPGFFTYSIPDEWIHDIQPGCRVIVQFGSKKVYSSIVREIHENEPVEYEVKPIRSVLDVIPVVNEFQLKLWEWIAQYYMCSPGEVMKAALPSGMKLESETRVYLNEDYKGDQKLSAKEGLLVDILVDRNIMSIKEISGVLNQKNVLSLVKTLLEKEIVFVEEKIRQGYKEKMQHFVRLNPAVADEKTLNKAFDQLENAPKQLELLMQFIKAVGANSIYEAEIQKSILLKEAGTSASVFQSLIDKKILVQQKKMVDRLANHEEKTGILLPLIDFQSKALEEIKNQWKNNDVTLLHGVTSSGKTEIYIQLINEQVQQGKQVLYLLPEIALTTQIINRLKKAFGNKTGIYHSKFSDNERYETWKRVISEVNSYQVILGVRSSVFLPFRNLGLVIVDEEHENTYKQYNPAPRYNARDTAIVLAAMHGAKVLLGTATPSLESYFNSKIEKYGYVTVNKRFGDIELPEIVVADLRESYRQKKMKGHFTPVLLNEMEETLKNNEQVILFQNRRGFSPYLECEVCGFIPKCDACDVSLTYHKNFYRLICHYCGYGTKIPSICPACGSPSLVTKGFGTEKIEDDMGIFFPGINVQRLDLDTARTRKNYEKIIHEFENNKIQVLIGTQMVSKGLDFNNVRVVGIMNADNLMNFPDFRSFERSYQLMAQVSGRAGRKNKRGRVIIQTSSPAHPVIKNVVENNFEQMFTQELADRKNYRYPPFFKLIRIDIKHKQVEKVNKASKEIADQLRDQFGRRVTGPEFPLIGRVQNWYIKNIFIKIEREKSFQKAKSIMRQIIDNHLLKEGMTTLQILIDVDPM